MAGTGRVPGTKQSYSSQMRQEKNWERIAAARIAHGTAAETAKALGCSAAEIYRHLRDPRYQEVERRMRRESWQEALAFVSGLALGSVRNLKEISADSKSDTARVAAAQALLKLIVSTGPVEELLRRIELLEQGRVADAQERQIPGAPDPAQQE